MPDDDTKPADGVSYIKSTAALDLEARLGEDAEVAPKWFESTNPVAPEKDSYVGTDPIYYDRANETDQPLSAEEGADKLAEEAAAAGYQKSEEKPAEEKAETKGKKTTFSTAATPAPTVNA